MMQLNNESIKFTDQWRNMHFVITFSTKTLKGSSADIVALTQITVEQANTNATNTHSFITRLLQTTTDPTEKKALTICENAYRLVMGSFQEAAMDFFSKDYKGMLESERYAPRAQASCIDIYNTPTSPPNPFGVRNRQMRILIAMAVAAGTELTSGSISSL
ncbi:hypothetical protein PTKIN_Ptkin01aG0318900 [Pterospermum kingtungense]